MTATGSEPTIDDRLIERREDVPATLPAGDYVVVDTLYFSNTVIELLAGGAAHVHVPPEDEPATAYRETDPRALVGGEPTDDLEPAEGHDFFNSPTDVQRLDVADRPVSVTSTNGGRTLSTLRARGGEDVEVFVGAPSNAAALGTHLRERERPTTLVGAGSEGAVALEDTVGAILVGRAVDGVSVSAAERAVFRRQIETVVDEASLAEHEVRRSDVSSYATNFDARATVPKLEDGVLVDVGDADAPASVPARTAT